jgi:hypothetical protein
LDKVSLLFGRGGNLGGVRAVVESLTWKQAGMLLATYYYAASVHLVQKTGNTSQIEDMHTVIVPHLERPKPASEIS